MKQTSIFGIYSTRIGSKKLLFILKFIPIQETFVSNKISKPFPLCPTIILKTATFITLIVEPFLDTTNIRT